MRIPEKNSKVLKSQEGLALICVASGNISGLCCIDWGDFDV